MGLANEILFRQRTSRGYRGADCRADRFGGARCVSRTDVDACSHSMPSRRRCQDVADAHEVVGRRNEHREPVNLRRSAQLDLSQGSDGLPPAEHFLDPLAQSLADGIAGVARGAGVDGTGLLLRHVRRQSQRAQLTDEVLCVVVLVPAQGAAPWRLCAQSSCAPPMPGSASRRR